MSERVQDASTPAGTHAFSGGSTSTAVSLANPAVVGNHIVVGIKVSGNGVPRTISGIADDGGTVFAPRGTRAHEATAGFTIDIWSGPATSTDAGANVVVTASGGLDAADNGRVIVLEVSGVEEDQSGAVSNHDETPNDSTSHTSGSVTPDNAADFVIALAGRTSGTYTEDTDFTEFGGAPNSGDREFFGYIENRESAISLEYTSDANEFTAQMIVSLVGVSGGISEEIAQVTESNSAQPFSVEKSITIGQVVETVSAQAMAALKARTIGQVLVDESAQAFSSSMTLEIGQVSSDESVQAMTAERVVDLDLAEETATAQPFTVEIGVSIGQVFEQDSAQALSSVKSMGISQVAEEATAQAFDAAKFRSIGQVSTEETARPINYGSNIVIFGVTVNESAQAFGSIKARTIGQVAENDSARALTHAKDVEIGQVRETVVVWSFSFGGVVSLLTANSSQQIALRVNNSTQELR